MSAKNEFLLAKEKAMISLKNAINKKTVDEEILAILYLINKMEDYYTSSSCAGRILVLELPRIGDKQHARFLGKWHHVIASEEVMKVVKHAEKGLIWLLAQSPIFHIGVRSSEMADRLVKVSNSCGFKNSGMRSLGKTIVVEIASTERLDAPIGKHRKLFCSLEHLDLLVDIANDIIKKSKEKIQRLEKKLGVIYI